MSAMAQLRSIYSEAHSRRNRLLLGQNMFGNGLNWVPRLEFLKSAENQLRFLKEQEELTTTYENTRKKQHKVEVDSEKALASLRSSKQAAEKQILLLTDTNGLLKTLAYKITSYTAEMRAKKEHVKDLVHNIQFDYKWDPKMIIDALSMLITPEKSPEFLMKVISLGYDGFLSTKEIKDDEGNDVKKDFIIRQIGICGDTIDSLMESFSTKKSGVLELDDPGAMKMLASVEDLQKIIDQLSNALGKDQSKEITKALNGYVEKVLARNKAVAEYNSGIQQLAEACKNRKYYGNQINIGVDRLLDIDPELPAVVFWLRNMQTNLQLSTMQYLEYERQSIRFWGLGEARVLSSPPSLVMMNYVAL
jgi:hypothetical protein